MATRECPLKIARTESFEPYKEDKIVTVYEYQECVEGDCPLWRLGGMGIGACGLRHEMG